MSCREVTTSLQSLKLTKMKHSSLASKLKTIGTWSETPIFLWMPYKIFWTPSRTRPPYLTLLEKWRDRSFTPCSQRYLETMGSHWIWSCLTLLTICLGEICRFSWIFIFVRKYLRGFRARCLHSTNGLMMMLDSFKQRDPRSKRTRTQFGTISTIMISTLWRTLRRKFLLCLCTVSILLKTTKIFTESLGSTSNRK